MCKDSIHEFHKYTQATQFLLLSNKDEIAVSLLNEPCIVLFPFNWEKSVLIMVSKLNAVGRKVLKIKHFLN